MARRLFDMSRYHAVITILLICFIAACSPTVTAPTEQPTAAPLPQTTNLPAPTNEPISTRVERRAPTLAPVATETLVVATAIPTATATFENSATPLPSATATQFPTRAQVISTATPQLAAGVYVTAFSIDPPQPKSKPGQFLFHVAFLNTVGENVNYPRWRVLIFPKGQNKAVGDPQGMSKTIVNGASQQDTEPWSINVANACESFTAQPIWENEDGKQTPLPQPDGKLTTIEFQVCP